VYNDTLIPMIVYSRSSLGLTVLDSNFDEVHTMIIEINFIEAFYLDQSTILEILEKPYHPHHIYRLRPLLLFVAVAHPQGSPWLFSSTASSFPLLPDRLPAP